jgi:hypothetical protein
MPESQSASHEDRQRVDISSPAAVERIWREAREEARHDSQDRERRAIKGSGR